MESHMSTQIKVGIFAALGTLVILGSIFFLGADKALFTKYIHLHSHFDQVQGLSVGSVVSLSGVTVGNVESITFLPEQNALDVQMKIDEDFKNRIRQGSQTEIRTQGALGDKYIFIIPSDPANPPVKNGDILDNAKATDLLGIISERGSETHKIFDVIVELQKTMHAINEENKLSRILNNLEMASKSLNQTGKDAQKLLQQINGRDGGEKLAQSFEKLDAVLTKIDKGQGSLGALINDPTIHNKLKTLLGGSTQKDRVKTLLRTSIEKEEQR